MIEDAFIADVCTDCLFLCWVLVLAFLLFFLLTIVFLSFFGLFTPNNLSRLIQTQCKTASSGQRL